MKTRRTRTGQGDGDTDKSKSKTPVEVLKEQVRELKLKMEDQGKAHEADLKAMEASFDVTLLRLAEAEKENDRINAILDRLAHKRQMMDRLAWVNVKRLQRQKEKRITTRHSQ